MLFTVFTPTYNRAKTIDRVLESLKRQTFRNFEWLIIDDGSTDGTQALIQSWIRDPDIDFPIRYYWQENNHKKSAHNRAVNEANGDMIVVFDSDDRCTPNALERFWYHWNAIEPAKQPDFVGVCGLCMDNGKQIVGDRFPAALFIDSDASEIRYYYGVSGEKWGAMRVDVLKRFPFREDIPGYVPEETVWGAIARSYNTRFFNEPIRIYSLDVPGLTARNGEVKDAAENSPGALYSKKQCLEYNSIYFRYRPKKFFLEAARLTRFWLHCPRYWRRRIGYWPENTCGKFLVVIGAPIGIGMFFTDKLRKIRQ